MPGLNWGHTRGPILGMSQEEDWMWSACHGGVGGFEGGLEEGREGVVFLGGALANRNL